MGVLGRALRRPKERDSGAMTSLFDGIFEGRSNVSGVSVTPDTALALPAAGRAIRAISRDVGTLPLLTYSGDGPDRKRRTSDPTYRLLRSRPNRDMNAAVFHTTVVRHLVGWGEAFIGKEAVPVKGGQEVVALWPIDPSRVVIDTSTDRKLFHVTTSKGPETLSSAHVIHVMLDSHDGYRGISPIAQHRQALAGQIGLARYGNRALSDRAVPPGVLKVPKPIVDPDVKTRMRKEWRKLYGPEARNADIAILDEGADFEALSIPLVDAQFMEQRRYGIVETAQIFNVPAHKLQGSTGDSLTYSTREGNQLEYLTDSLRPVMVAFEDAYNADPDLFPPARGTYCEFLPDALLRVDTMTRHRAYQIATGGAPWMRPSEIRPRENLTFDEGFDYAPKSALAPGGEGDEDGGDLTLEAATLAIQKIYLGVGTVISKNEARQILSGYGLDLPPVPGGDNEGVSDANQQA